MRWPKDKAKHAFNRAAQYGKAKRKHAYEVPRMIREDQSTPRPRPPGVGPSVDAQHFNQRWNQELHAHRPQGNTKSKVPSRDPMTKQFKRAVDPLDQITDKPRDRGLERW